MTTDFSSEQILAMTDASNYRTGHSEGVTMVSTRGHNLPSPRLHHLLFWWYRTSDALTLLPVDKTPLSEKKADALLS